MVTAVVDVEVEMSGTRQPHPRRLLSAGVWRATMVAAAITAVGCGRETPPPASNPTPSPAHVADAGALADKAGKSVAEPALSTLYAAMFKPGPFGTWKVDVTVETPGADGAEWTVHKHSGALNCNVRTANRSEGTPVWTATIGCEGDDVRAWLGGAIGVREVVTPATVWTADANELWVDVGGNPAADDSDEHGTKVMMPAVPQATRREMASDDDGKPLVEDFIEKPTLGGVPAEAWCQRRVHADGLTLTHCLAPDVGLVAIAGRVAHEKRRVQLSVVRQAP